MNILVEVRYWISKICFDIWISSAREAFLFDYYYRHYLGSVQVVGFSVNDTRLCSANTGMVQKLITFHW